MAHTKIIEGPGPARANWKPKRDCPAQIFWSSPQRWSYHFNHLNDSIIEAEILAMAFLWYNHQATNPHTLVLLSSFSYHFSCHWICNDETGMKSSRFDFCPVFLIYRLSLKFKFWFWTVIHLLRYFSVFGIFLFVYCRTPKMVWAFALYFLYNFFYLLCIYMCVYIFNIV